MRHVTFVAFLLAAAGCGSRSTPPPTEPVPAADPEVVTSLLFDVVEADTRLAQQVPLAPGDYDALARRIAALPGVEWAAYGRDTLGTIHVRVRGRGLLVYRHLTETWERDARAAPPGADFSGQLHPRHNAGWGTRPVESNPRAAALRASLDAALHARPAAVAADASNHFATHFPVADTNPDPMYSADDGVDWCLPEGRIAVVDFDWEEHQDVHPSFDVDGVNLWPRLKMIAEAAGFSIDHFDGQTPETTLDTTNFTLLEDYTFVIIIAHGSAPYLHDAVEATGFRMPLDVAMPTIVTPEEWSPTKRIFSGHSQERAWELGYLVRQVLSRDRGKVWWSPWLLRDFYHPRANQMFLLNSCWGLTAYGDFGFVEEEGEWVWKDGGAPQDHVPVYNFGDALRDAGVKVVFGFVTMSFPEAIVNFVVPFFRRQLGGNWAPDRPPSPHFFWPTCMGAQTFFRDPADPFTARYVNKTFTLEDPDGQLAVAVYTMYATDSNMTFREHCPDPLPLPFMQDRVLRLGTPATEFRACWDQYWSKGEYPTRFVNQVCSWGQEPTTFGAALDAACTVKVARKVTNALLETTAPPP